MQGKHQENLKHKKKPVPLLSGISITKNSPGYISGAACRDFMALAFWKESCLKILFQTVPLYITALKCLI
ncbi:hypothetical protein D770_24110 [Flammeovirgaceae bacterium 311]|nr:hypothetical protein D770_24110 [Flammeovirgaceae bacterium 311]